MDNPNTGGLRTSSSNPSLKPISNRTGPTRSATSHLGSYRHALLKSNAKSQRSIEKDLPVPPVLTDNHSIPNVQDSRPQEPMTQTPISVRDAAHPIESATLVPANTNLKGVVADGIQSPGDGYDHFHTWRLPVSKVRPAVYDIEEDDEVDLQGEYPSSSVAQSEVLYPVEDHFQHSHSNTPKVRPYVEVSSIGAPNPQAGDMEAEQASVARPTDQLPFQGGESQKVATYWGFLPGFRARRGKKRLETGRQEDGQPTPGSREGSSHPSYFDSQRSLTSARLENAESEPKQENTPQDKTSHRDSEASKNVSISSGRRNGGSVTSVSRPPLPSPDYTSINEGRERFLPQKLDTSRTARWLRGLKTIFPAKNSRRCRFSNVKENILTEALSLADEAGKRGCGHVDDSNLPLRPSSEVSVYTPSVDESIRRGSSEQEGEILAISLPDMATGAVCNVDDGPEILPLRSVKRSGLFTSIKRDGKILRPYFLKRTAKATSNIGDRYHTVDDDCVLPMPRSDRGTRRDRACLGLCGYNEDDLIGSIKSPSKGVPNSREVRKYIQSFHQPPICTRGSSKPPHEVEGPISTDPDSGLTNRLSEIRRQNTSVCSLDGGTSDDAIDFSSQYSTGEKRYSRFPSFRESTRRVGNEKPARKYENSRKRWVAPTKHAHELRNVSLRNRSHVSIDEGQRFSLTKSARRQPTIARDWSPARKRFVAAVACISTALIGTLVGIYAGLVPSIQYYIADFHHYAILGNVASLMSNTPHQEVVDEYDVRRHGGGLGVWLGIWTWCFIGSLSVGFLVGAVVIEHLQPSWGLYISIIIIAAVLLLNVLCPEVRRSAWRRSVAEVRIGETISRRLARGEVMMHRVQTGPRWWGQEVYHGVALSLEMLRQPGFTIMAVYSAWIYAQIILIIVLLGSLTSKSYRYRAPYVGAIVSSVAIGAFIAIPFQKANIFSRARNMGPKSNETTFDKKITWSSHLVRRAIFTFVLPIAGIAYTGVSTGPPIHVFFPSFFAALIGFLSCLAISECNGMLMENWDCSDLQPGITGRSKSSKDSHKRTNYSSFPRATAGWNLIQSLGFVFAAGATGLGGSVTRRLGQRTATGVVAGILFILTLLLLGTFIRFKRVQIIPDCTCSEMDRWAKERRVSHHNWAAAMAAAKEKGKKELNEIPEDDVG
ncbi:hypothetical protein GQX73_g7687 [Xylaria multiplex]|uniref:Major facilitator superfamily (MFS) profile domain-containing protein n=1 Tax=Xylaria multiplex TaxID=323545 RepID=A0A7C8N1A8_9PEZI|nr:hypothetical protein GQX73_g7687 [Xylaria multiplex]